MTPFLARHVLALEAAHKEGWLGRLGLVEAVDAYVANTQSDGKPRMPIPVAQFRSSVNYANGKRVPEVPKPPTGKVEPVTLQKPVPVRGLKLLSDVSFVHRHTIWQTCVLNVVAVKPV